MATAQMKRSVIAQPFTPLTDAEFFFFTRLGREDLLAAYIELKRHCWTGKNLCWPSAERQAEETGRKLATVRRRLIDLELLGVIRVIRSSQSKQRTNRYILTPANEWQLPAALQIKKTPDRPRSLDSDRRRAAEHDRRRSPKQIDPPKPDQEKTNKQVLITQLDSIAAHAGQPRHQDVVVPQEVSEQLRSRLQALGVVPGPSITITMGKYNSTALERATDCLEAARKLDNPSGYFLAALRNNWSPPVSFTEVRTRKQAQDEIRQRQAAIDSLARVWGLRPGLALVELAGEIQREFDRYRQPITERIHEWTTLGRSPEKAEQCELEHDARIQSSILATHNASFQELLANAGVTL